MKRGEDRVEMRGKGTAKENTHEESGTWNERENVDGTRGKCTEKECNAYGENGTCIEKEGT